MEAFGGFGSGPVVTFRSKFGGVGGGAGAVVGGGVVGGAGVVFVDPVGRNAAVVAGGLVLILCMLCEILTISDLRGVSMGTCDVVLLLTVDAPCGEIGSVSLFMSQTGWVVLAGDISRS